MVTKNNIAGKTKNKLFKLKIFIEIIYNKKRRNKKNVEILIYLFSWEKVMQIRFGITVPMKTVLLKR